MAEFIETRTVDCPYCGSNKVVKNGRRDGYQRYLCRPCGKQFKHTGELHGRHAPTGRIAAAIRMFYSGLSYKQIGENLAERDEIPEPSKQTIYEWVKEYTDEAVEAMQDYPAQTGPEWVADEMQVKVGGEQLWNWNVMDAKTRYVLASHLTPNRDIRAAVAVLQKAARAAATPPETIKTDRLGSYPAAIKEVFPEAKHVKSDGIRALINNNRSERLQGTYRQREKTLRGLDNIETGQRYLDGWTLQYNLFREHEGISFQTPGEAAKVNAPFTEWEDVVKATPTPSERSRTGQRDAAAALADGERRGETTARGNVIFVPDPTQRRRPKGESDAEPWPPPLDEPNERSARPALPKADDAASRERPILTGMRLPPLRTYQQAARIAASPAKQSRPKRHPFLRPAEHRQERGIAKKGRRRTPRTAS